MINPKINEYFLLLFSVEVLFILTWAETFKKVYVKKLTVSQRLNKWPVSGFLLLSWECTIYALYLDMLIMISHKFVICFPTIFTGVESSIYSSLISRRKFHEPPVGVNLLIRNWREVTAAILNKIAELGWGQFSFDIFRSKTSRFVQNFGFLTSL